MWGVKYDMVISADDVNACIVFILILDIDIIHKREETIINSKARNVLIFDCEVQRKDQREYVIFVR